MVQSGDLAKVCAYPRFLLGNTFAHLFFSQQSPRIAWTSPEQTVLVVRRRRKLLLVVTDVKVLSDTR